LSACFPLRGSTACCIESRLRLIGSPPGVRFSGGSYYFANAEGNKTLADRCHGTDGPLRVKRHLPSNALVERFLAAAQEVGIPFNPDFNGEFQEGCGPLQATLANRGRRADADGPHRESEPGSLPAHARYPSND
jgi:hypothetical protein